MLRLLVALQNLRLHALLGYPLIFLLQLIVDRCLRQCQIAPGMLGVTLRALEYDPVPHNSSPSDTDSCSITIGFLKPVPAPIPRPNHSAAEVDPCRNARLLHALQL